MGSTGTPSTGKHRRLESMYTITGLYSDQSTMEDSELESEPQADKKPGLQTTGGPEKGHKRALSSGVGELLENVKEFDHETTYITYVTSETLKDSLTESEIVLAKPLEPGELRGGPTNSYDYRHHKRTLSNGIHEVKSQNYKLNTLDIKKHVRSSSSGYQEIRSGRKTSSVVVMVFNSGRRLSEGMP
ncbi:hypothetical protein RUM44_002478 [Polyplax serrata]|uniref:Uncharacterized protein n=1 Tax=Polyplax serrata TaxID=468196 RepID=A0ABR1AEW3_POLSC